MESRSIEASHLGDEGERLRTILPWRFCWSLLLLLLHERRKKPTDGSAFIKAKHKLSRRVQWKIGFAGASSICKLRAHFGVWVKNHSPAFNWNCFSSVYF
jgi:hypothetical protein